MQLPKSVGRSSVLSDPYLSVCDSPRRVGQSHWCSRGLSAGSLRLSRLRGRPTRSKGAAGGGSLHTENPDAEAPPPQPAPARAGEGAQCRCRGTSGLICDCPTSPWGSLPKGLPRRPLEQLPDQRRDPALRRHHLVHDGEVVRIGNFLVRYRQSISCAVAGEIGGLLA